jgi:hypothetical protein
MESGMACTPGVSMTFSQAATAGTSKRHLHSHMRRHAESHGESLH